MLGSVRARVVPLVASIKGGPWLAVACLPTVLVVKVVPVPVLVKGELSVASIAWIVADERTVAGFSRDNVAAATSVRVHHMDSLGIPITSFPSAKTANTSLDRELG